MFDATKYFNEDLVRKFEFYNYNHAYEILSTTFISEFNEILNALKAFELSTSDLLTAGGNESPIPPKFSKILSPAGWEEIKITGDLLIHFFLPVCLRSSKKKSRLIPSS